MQAGALNHYATVAEVTTCPMREAVSIFLYIKKHVGRLLLSEWLPLPFFRSVGTKFLSNQSAFESRDWVCASCACFLASVCCA